MLDFLNKVRDETASTSQWDAADYARVGGFVPALGQAALDLLDPQPGEHILDVGCGDGTLTLKIKQAGAEVVGIDNSLSMIGAAPVPEAKAAIADRIGRLAEALEPWSCRRFLNFADSPSEAELLFGAADHRRLREVKRRYDPGERLVSGLHIDPA